MKAKYLGLDLSSPVVVSSSPYTATVSNIEQCVRNGAGAVVLKSIFEEQIYRQAASLDRMEGYGDAGNTSNAIWVKPIRRSCWSWFPMPPRRAFPSSAASTAPARATRGSNMPRPCSRPALRHWS